MSVSYLRDDYMMEKLIPIATTAINQILRDIKALDLSDDDTMRAFRGTISTLTALSIDKSCKGGDLEQEQRIYFDEVKWVLDEVLGKEE